MIKQAAVGLNSRSEANPFDENGFLPLITAPMYSIVDESNYQIFLDNKIQVCLPRKCKTDTILYTSYPLWLTYSLEDFNGTFLQKEPLKFKHKICIDTANGNIPQLHDAIRKAKEIHGDNLIIMAGNVASVEAFVELAKTGCDYIRVGIGGGGGCNTTSNTGVGQEDLYELICSIKRYQNQNVDRALYFNSSFDDQEQQVISKVKIVADGISSYIKQCESKYGFNDNGYAAINKLLFAGADLVMIGKLFAQCLESAGEKAFYDNKTGVYCNFKNTNDILDHFSSNEMFVKYSGMSTQQEQLKYKKPLIKRGDIVYEKKDIQQEYPIKVTMIEHGFIWGITQNCANCKEIGYDENNITLSKIKPSEGSVQWIPVRWTLNEWLNGSANQDESPYLMGWINSIKSAMAYTGKTSLQ